MRLIIGLLTVLLAYPCWAQSMKDLAGTYAFVYETREQDGKSTEVRRKGRLALAPSGRYVLLLVGLNLPKIASNNRLTATPEEARGVVGESVAHFGTYSVEGDTLVFHIDTSTFANWDGTVQRRAFALKGDQLTYSVPTGSGGGRLTLTWKRED